MTEHCFKCGRFVGFDAQEVIGPGNFIDPDGYTGQYVCERCAEPSLRDLVLRAIDRIEHEY